MAPLSSSAFSSAAPATTPHPPPGCNFSTPREILPASLHIAYTSLFCLDEQERKKNASWEFPDVRERTELIDVKRDFEFLQGCRFSYQRIRVPNSLQYFSSQARARERGFGWRRKAFFSSCVLPLFLSLSLSLSLCRARVNTSVATFVCACVCVRARSRGGLSPFFIPSPRIIIRSLGFLVGQSFCRGLNDSLQSRYCFPSVWSPRHFFLS